MFFQLPARVGKFKSWAVSAQFSFFRVFQIASQKDLANRAIALNNKLCDHAGWKFDHHRTGVKERFFIGMNRYLMFS
jgi:hypothetical protein